MWNGWKTQVVSSKGRIWLIIALVGMGLLILPSRNPKESTAVDESEYVVRYYSEHMEERIEMLCLQIRGMKEVHVLLTLDGGNEYVYAEDRTTTTQEYVLLSREGGEEPLPVKEIYPRIRGVAVVCSGGDDSAVQRKVTELLSAALGIPSSSIRVAGT